MFLNDAPHSGKNNPFIAPADRRSCSQQRSRICRRPRHYPPTGRQDSHRYAARRRKGRSGSPQENHFAEKRNSRGQRRVGRPLSQILRRRAAPLGNCRSARRTPPGTKLLTASILAVTFKNLSPQKKRGGILPPLFFKSIRF